MDAYGVDHDFDKARKYLDGAGDDPWALNQRGIMFWEGIFRQILSILTVINNLLKKAFETL